MYFFLALFLTGFACCFSEDVDPILIDKPSEYVFECGDNIFFEIISNVVIDKTASGRYTDDYYLTFSAEILFLEDEPWKGIDKESFVLRFVDAEGNGSEYPLNYMMTNMAGMKNSWNTFSDTLKFAELRKVSLIFDVNRTEKRGWSLLFRPAERGGEAVCELEIPLRIN